MKDSKHIKLLFERYLNNHASREETAELFQYFQDTNNKEALEQMIENQLESRDKEELIDKMILDRVFGKIDLDTEPQNITSPTWYKITGVAAAIILIISISYLFLNRSTYNDHTATIIEPGRDKATLVLSSGKTIVLEDVANGKLTEELGTTIEKTEKGGINYKIEGNTDVRIAMNLLNVPKGGQFQITLSDGTKVWLNSNSSLKYPSAFSASERRVELKGEAYFEVSKNKQKPFIVETSLQKVEVLGTKFNINAYDDESSTQTSLAEGSVRVSCKNNTTLLKPGQQSTLTDQNIAVRSTNLDQVLDWKNGDFNFSNNNLKEIMRKISRWYNIEVIFEGPISQETYVAQISRKKRLNDVLRALQLSGSIKYSIRNNKLYISQ
ncbi:FecR family protein [Sphingobacterium siyangense]|uniref:FecR family protein n=1 Tax=Sphingobacterium siyangense TaxID=459529 RepID=UPI0028A5B43F|nr:FecR family protein [Sphingobacterium siyangense]